MSRIGKLPINVPAGVTISVEDTLVTVKGPKGVLTQEINPNVVITVEDGTTKNKAVHSMVCTVHS